jgi:hypothetical protein
VLVRPFGLHKTNKSQAGIGDVPYPITDGAMVFDIRSVTMVVLFDIRSPVEVRVHGDETSLTRIVEERPSDRVRGGEHEPATRTKHASNLVQDSDRVRDERERPVRRACEVEHPVPEWEPLGVSLNHRQNRPCPGIKAPGVAELPPRQVDAHGIGALDCEPAPTLPAAAADL